MDNADYAQCPKWWCRKKLHTVDVGGVVIRPGQRLLLHLASCHPKLWAKRMRALRIERTQADG